MTWTNPSVLRESAYADPGRLTARTSIYEFQRPQVDLPGAVLDTVSGLMAGSRVADLGCGPGRYLHRLSSELTLRLVGLDLSHGMVSAVDRSVADVLVGSVDRLPLASQSLDGALALHMLYHLSSPAAGLAELRRVLRPGGLLVTSTNDDRDSGLWQLFADAGIGREPVSVHWPLQAAAGSLAAAGFVDVAVREFGYVLELPVVAPVLDYLESCRATFPDIADRAWAEIRQRVSLAAQTELDRSGMLSLAGRTGVAIGHAPG